MDTGARRELTADPVAQMQSGKTIGTRPQPTCFLCGRPGNPLYQGLTDRLFGAPGMWHLKQCPAGDCGLVWLDPMPAEEDISKAYETYYTHPAEAGSAGLGLAFRTYLVLRDGYLSRRFGYPATTLKRLFAPLIALRPAWKAEADFSVLHQGAPRSKLSLLDIGCGDGVAIHGMAQLGWDVHGIDVDPQAVERARQRGLDVRLGALAAESFVDATFDVVTMSHVIEHVHTPVELLRECRRILKPNGKLVVYTPNVQSRGHALFKSAWLALDPPRHLHLFTVTTLGKVLDRSGQWSIERLTTTVRGAPVIFTASDDIRRHGRAVMGRKRTFRERVATNALVTLEWASLAFRPTVGEELLLIAVRPD